MKVKLLYSRGLGNLRAASGVPGRNKNAPEKFKAARKLITIATYAPRTARLWIYSRATGALASSIPRQIDSALRR